MLVQSDGHQEWGNGLKVQRGDSRTSTVVLLQSLRGEEERIM